MGAFANRSKATANKLIKKYGDSVTIIHRYDCVYDPVTGDNICTEDFYPMKGQVTNYSIQDLGDESILSDDLQLIVRTDMDITPKWQVQYKDVIWEVVSTPKRVATQDQTVIQTIQIRKVTL